MNRFLPPSTLAILGVLALPSMVQAYVGPGAILTGIGAFLAFVVALFAAIFGFFWFPIKRTAGFMRRTLSGRGERSGNPVGSREESKS